MLYAWMGKNSEIFHIESFLNKTEVFLLEKNI